MRRSLLIVPALTLLLAVAACGDDSGDGIATGGGTADADPVTEETALTEEEQMLAFTQCMRDEGIDMPDPEPDQGGVRIGGGAGDLDPAAIQAALEQCRDLLPDGGPMGEPDPEREEQMRAFAQCMRDNGVDMPDPEPGGGPNAAGLGAIDMSDPVFQAALEECEKLGTIQRRGQR